MILIKNFLVDIFPEIAFDYKETNNNKKLILRNLNQKLIDQLTADDIEKIGDFYVNASKKYKRADLVKRMTFGLQKNAQIHTLQEIIAKYELLLKENPPESSWQKFFDEYITLFDTRYAHKINYKNIATGITKYPDLVLVDIYGYIDFYELKKSNTPLMKYDSSHKTWYWTKDVSMVIAQATDYLQKSKENAISYTKAIKEETETESEEGIDVKPFYTKDDRPQQEVNTSFNEYQVCQSVFIDDEKIANNIARTALEKGADAIQFVADKRFDFSAVFFPLKLDSASVGAKVATHLLFAFHMLFVNILLVSLLIAMFT